MWVVQVRKDAGVHWLLILPCTECSVYAIHFIASVCISETLALLKRSLVNDQIQRAQPEACSPGIASATTPPRSPSGIALALEIHRYDFYFVYTEADMTSQEVG